MSMTSSLSSRDRNNAANFRHIYFCHEDDDDVGDIGKHDFRFVLHHPMLSYANLVKEIYCIRHFELSEPDENNSTTYLVYYLISDYRRGMTLDDGKLAQINFNTRI